MKKSTARSAARPTARSSATMNLAAILRTCPSGARFPRSRPAPTRRLLPRPIPACLNLDSFTDLGVPRDLAKIFDTVEYAKWRSFRESEDSRYVGLTMPRTLMRLPYGPETIPVESFNFKEDVDGKDHAKYLWGNAAWSFGTRLTECVCNAWMVRCHSRRRGRRPGARVCRPIRLAPTTEKSRSSVPLRLPSQTGARRNLSDLGFIPLVHCKGTDYAAFFGAQSCQKAKKYDTDAANANARLSTQLQYMMAMSRFAHYLKSMMRDKIGSFMSRSDCERFLNRWIMNYVTADDNASATTKRNTL